MKAKNQTSSVETSVGEAKLPKLVITKFNGAYSDWPRVWIQNAETIDKTKFVYLGELLDPKVRKTVSILKDRFGKRCEIMKAYLPYTSTGNPKRIYEFYDKLSHSEQSLETLSAYHLNGICVRIFFLWTNGTAFFSHQRNEIYWTVSFDRKFRMTVGQGLTAVKWVRMLKARARAWEWIAPFP